MSKMTITLEDTDDGLVGQTLNFHGKYDPNSNAHRYGNIMIWLAMDAQKDEPQQDKPMFDLSHLAASGPVSEIHR